METIIERLNKLTTKLTDLGTTMYSKWGTESYVERCDNADIRDEIIKVIERLKTLPIEPAEMSEEIKPPKWYSKQEMYDWLIVHSYSKEIATELSQIWADDLQGAFNKGWDKRGYELQSQKTESAEEILEPCITFKDRHNIKCLKYEDAIMAVDYYLQNQSHQVSQEARPTDEIRDELIGFCCACNIPLPRDKDYIDLVDGYLSKKETDQR
jgi:hypothetical protein